MKKTMRRRMFIIFSVCAVVLLWIGAYFFIDVYSNGFVLQFLSIDEQQKKLPFNSPYLEFSFSQDIDSATITSSDISFSPHVDGTLEVVHGNTLRYKFEESLQIDEVYTVTLQDTIKNTKGKRLDKVYEYDITAVSAAKVVFVSPEWSLDALHQNIVIMFSIPMVALTNKDQQDSLPCPVDIKPALKWTCSRTSTSIVEFTPETYFAWATTYDVTVNNDEGFLYPLQDEYTTTIKTTPLQIFAQDTFNPFSWIVLQTNFPVDTDSIKKSIRMYDASQQLVKFDITANDKQTEFILTNSQWVFWFDTSFSLQSADPILPKYGNIPLATFGTTVHSQPYAYIPYLIKNTISATWEIVDSQYLYYNASTNQENQYYDQSQTKYIPIKDFYFPIQSELLDLSDNLALYSLTSKDGKKIAFTLAYGIQEVFDSKTWKTVTKENKKMLFLTPKEVLDTNTMYTLTIKKSSHSTLTQDLTFDYLTSPALIIADYIQKDYNYWCLYTNTYLPYDTSEITSQLQTKIDAFVRGMYMVYSDPETCPIRTIDGKNAMVYRIVMQLTPDSTYTMQFPSSLENSYGAKLQTPFSKVVTTQSIKDEDTFIYSTHRYKSVYPFDQPLVVNTQTMNRTSAFVETCVMWLQNFIKFLPWYYDEIQWSWYENSYNKNWWKTQCLQYKNKSIPTKNKRWNLTQNIFDVEKDILEQKMLDRFVYVRASKNEWDKIPSVENMYIRSNMSVLMEKAENLYVLFATDFEWNRLSNVKFTFYNQQWTIVNVPYRRNTEKETYEILPNNVEFRFVTAEKSTYYWFLDMESDSFDNYDFWYVAGRSTSQKDYAYLYIDRPIYKPWDTVHFKWILRVFDFDWYKKTDIEKVTFTVQKANQYDNESLFSQEFDVDQYGNIIGEYKIPQDIWLWQFILSIQAADRYIQTNQSDFFVEEYVKPEFALNTSTPKTDFMLWDATKIAVSPEYYFGWKVTNTQWDYVIYTQKYFFDAKEYQQYQFWEWSSYNNCVYRWWCEFNDAGIYPEWQSFDIDNTWTHTIDYVFEQDWSTDWDFIYSFVVNVQDPETKKFVSKTVSQVVHTTDAYVWLRVPYRQNISDWIAVEWIVLDRDAKELANKKVQVSLIYSDRKSVKKQWVDGVFYNDYTLEETLVDQKSLASNASWQFDTNFAIVTWWDYKVIVSYTWTNGFAFVSTADSFVSDNSAFIQDSYRNEWNNSVTELIADTQRAFIWDTVSFTLQSPVNNWSALVVVEKDDGILDYFVQEITNFDTRISIKVEDSYYPNIYVKAYLIWKEKNNPLPIYKRALSVVKIDTEHKRLTVDLQTDKDSYAPRQTVTTTVRVVDASGSPVQWAHWSLAIVDMSVLALKWNPKNNPYAFFYDMKRYLGVVSYWSLKFLVEKLEVKDATDWSKWWDGDQTKGWDSVKKRWIFKDTARRNADFVTDKNWEAILVSEALPDNLTTRQLETILTDPVDNKIWVAYKEIRSTQDILIRDNLPSVLWQDDTIVLSPIVVNNTSSQKKLTLVVTWSYMDILWNQWTTTVTIAPNSQTTISIPVRIEQTQQRQSMITMTLLDQDATVIDALQKFVPLVQTSLLEHISTFWVTQDQSIDEKIDLTAVTTFDWVKQWRIRVKYAPSLLWNIFDGIEYLWQMPYGCLEQRFSAFMPYVYLSSLHTQAGIEYDLSKKMIPKRQDDQAWYVDVSVESVLQEELATLDSFQLRNGGFTFWNNAKTQSTCSDTRLTIQTLQRLWDIATIWYYTDSSIWKSAIQFLTNRFYQKDKQDTCYAVATLDQKLAILQAILIYDPWYYEAYKMYQTLSFDATTRSSLISQAKVLVLLSQIESLDSKIQSEYKLEAVSLMKILLNNELVITPKWSYIGKTSYASRLTNTAYFLEIMSTLWLTTDPQYTAITQNVLRWIVEQKEDWHRWSTYENLLVIKAVSVYLWFTKELEDVSLDAIVITNSTKVDKETFTNKNKLDTKLYEQTLDWLPDYSTISLQKKWDWSLYYDISLEYLIDTKDIDARDEWFFVQSAYYPYDQYKNIKNKKQQEWNEYAKWKISYQDLAYPLPIIDYLDPITQWEVWEYVIAVNTIYTNETRDQVAFDGYIPAWSSLVNTTLATSQWKVDNTQDNSREFENDLERQLRNEVNYNNSYQNGNYNPSPQIIPSLSSSIVWTLQFDTTEYRYDKYFGYASILSPWKYEFTYVLQLTHNWSFHIKPSTTFEFYEPEVFGRTAWNVFTIWDENSR